MLQNRLHVFVACLTVAFWELAQQHINIDSTCLPPVWPRFTIPASMLYVGWGFVVFNSFLLCSEGFFLWLPWFSPLLKNQPFQIPIQLRMHVHLWTSSQEILSASWIYHFLFLEKLQEKNRGVGGNRGGSRGRVQGVRIPTWDDLQFSNTTGLISAKKKKLCGLLVLK